MFWTSITHNRLSKEKFLFEKVFLFMQYFFKHRKWVIKKEKNHQNKRIWGFALRIPFWVPIADFTPSQTFISETTPKNMKRRSTETNCKT